MVEVKLVTAPVEISEGPHWDETNQCLLYVDAMKGRVHRYFPALDRHMVLDVEAGSAGETVCFALPVEGRPDLLVVGLGRSLAVLEWPLNSPDSLSRGAKGILHTVEQERPTNLFNDGKCDPRGRIWAGTMGREKAAAEVDPELGALYCLDTDCSLLQKVPKISLSNGLSWSVDNTTLYFIDSSTYSIDAFDYHATSGDVSNRRKVLDYKAAGLEKDLPDGMCVDETGNIWAANFFGQKVICVDPKAGKIVRQVNFPTPNITSACWGGPDYSTLFVTSSQTGLTNDQLKADPKAGGVFAVTGLGVKGQAPNNFKVNPELLMKKLTA